MISPHRLLPWFPMLIAWLMLGLSPLTIPAQPSSGVDQTPPQPDRRVLIVSIDGLRPDLALRADMPTLRGLMKRGSYSFWAQTTAMSVTLPSHVSMLTGVPPQRHQIVWNTDDMPLARPVYPAFPTIFEIAKAQGLTTAVVAGKTKFNTLLKPGTVDWSYVTPLGIKDTDSDMANQAIDLIQQHAPIVLFVHFPAVDHFGHGYGWGSDLQIEAIENADKQLGRVLQAIDQAKRLDQTLVIVTADHGGAGRNHGPDDPRSRHIPWVAAGPKVTANHDLNRRAEVAIRIEDTFATACDFLGLKLPRPVDGQVVKAIYEPVPSLKK